LLTCCLLTTDVLVVAGDVILGVDELLWVAQTLIQVEEVGGLLAWYGLSLMSARHAELIKYRLVTTGKRILCELLLAVRILVEDADVEDAAVVIHIGVIALRRAGKAGADFAQIVLNAIWKHVRLPLVSADGCSVHGGKQCDKDDRFGIHADGRLGELS